VAKRDYIGFLNAFYTLFLMFAWGGVWGLMYLLMTAAGANHNVAGGVATVVGILSGLSSLLLIGKWTQQDRQAKQGLETRSSSKPVLLGPYRTPPEEVAPREAFPIPRSQAPLATKLFNLIKKSGTSGWTCAGNGYALHKGGTYEGRPIDFWMSRATGNVWVKYKGETVLVPTNPGETDKFIRDVVVQQFHDIFGEKDGFADSDKE